MLVVTVRRPRLCRTGLAGYGGFVMFGNRISLFELFGFRVQVDVSWLFLAALVTWSLAVGYFPSQFEGLTRVAYWWMGAVGMIGLAFSIVFHELAHSLVARHFNIPIKGITLFIFGGVAEMDEEPPDPRSEFLMAIAGPIGSFILAAAFYAMTGVGEARGLPPTITGVTSYLALINAILGAFNLVPAFPLDGGRALRAALWHQRGDLRAATRRASQFGSAFGMGLIAVGIFSFVTGNLVGGLWWCLIGFFLRSAATASYYQLITRRSLEGETVARFMTTTPISVPREVPLDRFVEDFAYRHNHEFFPVAEGGRPLGGVTTRQVSQVPRDQWPTVRVGDVMFRCTAENTIGSGDDAMRALSIMQRSGNTRLMVVDGGQLVGIIALKDLLKFFALKVDLEGLR